MVGSGFGDKFPDPTEKVRIRIRIHNSEYISKPFMLCVGTVRYLSQVTSCFRFGTVGTYRYVT